MHGTHGYLRAQRSLACRARGRALWMWNAESDFAKTDGREEVRQQTQAFLKVEAGAGGIG